MEETRNGLRSAVLKHRSALSPQTCLTWSRSIQAKVLELPQYLTARSIALYCATGNEVETRAIRVHAFGQRKKVFCPKMSGDPGRFAQIFSEADLVPGAMGVAVPLGDTILSEADWVSLMVIVPGVVFDDRGNRLGRGGGWYDRALQRFDNRGVFVGLAYEVQVVDRVPAQLWDKKVHHVITEARVIDCGASVQRRTARWH